MLVISGEAGFRRSPVTCLLLSMMILAAGTSLAQQTVTAFGPVLFDGVPYAHALVTAKVEGVCPNFGDIVSGASDANGNYRLVVLLTIGFPGTQAMVNLTADGALPDDVTPWHAEGLLIVPLDQNGNGQGFFPIMGSSSSVPDGGAGPLSLSLRATPNPSAGAVRISYQVPVESTVRLDVFDPAGRLVRALTSGRQAAGSHTVLWDGRGDDGRSVPRGIFFTRLRIAGSDDIGRIVLLAGGGNTP